MPTKPKEMDELGIEGQEMPSIDFNRSNFKDKLTDIASKQLNASSSFKKPRIEQWRKFDEMYNGKIKKRLRQLFQVPLPVYSGMIDTLAASYDEPIEIEFHKKHPADYFKAKKTQAMWNMEKASLGKNGRWDFKSRIDKKTNIRYGRSILKFFAESDPIYRSVLENTSPYYFHNQPMGGGLNENHLFNGEENIFKSEFDIRQGVAEGIYDAEQVKKLKLRTNSKEYMQALGSEHEEKMARFRSLGLDPDRDNYVGEPRFNMVEWVLTYKGKRWYVLFDAWTKTWIRVEPLKELYSKELYPWTSWASHEDDQVFWSIGFGDILYPCADSIMTLFNQELTNREKINFNPRAYDKDMIPNVGQLDRAQYRADALVEVNTFGGSRKLSDAVYRFESGEIQGTTNLIDWVRTGIGKDTGITDIAQGASIQATKKVNVAFMEQASIAKRIGYKSKSYTECWGEIGLRYRQGLIDHMSKEQYIEVLGEEGIEPDVMTRDDLYTKADLGVRIIESSSQKAEAELKKQGRIQGYGLLANSQNVNSEMRDAGIMRDVMGMTEAEIRQWLDTHNYASRDSIAKAHIVIQELLDGEEPALNFAADIPFLNEIRNYAIEHRNKLSPKDGEDIQDSTFYKFMQYFAAHAQIIKGKDGQPQAQGIAVNNEVNKAKQAGRIAGKKKAMSSSSKRPIASGRPMAGAAVNPSGGQQPEVAQA